MIDAVLTQTIINKDTLIDRAAGILGFFTEIGGLTGLAVFAATSLELPPAAAGAEIIASRSFLSCGLKVPPPHPLHDVGGSSPLPQLGSHKLHVGIDVLEKQLVSRAEIIQAFLPIRRTEEAVLRALTVAGKANLAFAAVFWERIPFILAELALLRGADQAQQGTINHVAQPVLRIDVMVARVEIAIVFDGHGVTARPTKDAQAGLHPHPGLECDIKKLDVKSPHIAPHPLVEDRAKK